jgi:hypothetical protein
MLSKVHKPKSKQDLIRAIQSAPIKTFKVYEDTEVNQLPSKAELVRQGATVIIIQ